MTSPPPAWYAVAQGVTCLSAAWAIGAMYLRGTPVRQGEPVPAEDRDPGLGWLGLAVSIWGVVGLLLLLPLGDKAAQATRTLLSSANSACLLISASYLDYGPRILRRASEHPHYKPIALGGSLLVALVTIALYATLGPDAQLARAPDFALSAVTLLLYGFGLFRSFLSRGFAPLAALALLATVLQFAAQLPEIVDPAALALDGDRRWVLNLASKTMVLIAFLSLAMSWVHEVARRPSRSAVRLRFSGRRTGSGNRRRFVVELADRTVEMRETPHRDLLALAVARVLSPDPDGGWVALPDLVGRLDDSRIRRMREDLRAAGLSEAIESNFQKSYRLALAPQHIDFDRTSLSQEPELASLLTALDAPRA
ncbi:MAG: hypothetical protein R3B70_22420 [Polyangiaceae bacterium]